jgi:hypothetical protein
MQHDPKRRRRMLAFKLAEISAVTVPAQKFATVARTPSGEPFMKRDTTGDQTMSYDQEEGADAILKRAAELVEEGMTPTAAMTQARLEDHGSYQAWNGEAVTVTKEEDDDYAEVTTENFQRLGAAEFDATVRKICNEYEVTPTEAMRIVRREEPWLYHAMEGHTPDQLPDDVFDKANGPADQQLQLKAQRIAHNEGCSMTEGMRRARRRHPDLYQAAQSAPTRKADDLAGMRGGDRSIADGTAKRDWMQFVSQVQERMSVTSGKATPYTKAMQQARQERPDLFAAYQGIGGEQAHGRDV